MPKCSRNGCGQDYEESSNSSTSCHYHSGAPVFHEGLKSWSCCSDVNRPVLDFESFMAISGCSEGSHTQERPKPQPPTSGGSNGRETYSTTLAEGTRIEASTSTITNSVMTSQPAAVILEEEDDVSIPVTEGTPCRRRGCNAKFVSDEKSRLDDGGDSVCTYHPAPPLFREGSKGYLCCKRRVLEFDEFLKIQGCKVGKHLFSPKQTQTSQAEELITCRIDHYQTPTQVHVSVFAKQVDKNASSIRLEDSKVYLNLIMAGSKRFQRTLDLYGLIDPSASKSTFFGTKVELVLAKADMRSWLLLEKTNHSTAGMNLTFGVGGRTGTIGGKEIVLSDDNKLIS
ncbi:chord-domain-containing protein [Ramaria rubella]|nr:chord-domain-containing protein [Ramaria rubella]